MFKRWRWLAAGGMAVLVLASGWWYWRLGLGDARLRAFVHAPPPVPIVFTSRSEPASLRAAAPAGEVFTYPGQPLWQAREGRLRLLTPAGEVRELTWGQRLDDGGTLIDVMSPSLSMDGRKIVFAGRRADDHGHFRLYEIGIDGRGLRRLTGGPDDAGCSAAPPMRFGADGKTLLAEAERKRIDYDDVDPVYLDYSNRFLAFASSRTPDLGRGHSRRATNLWLLHLPEGQKYPATANRYNDRWPFMLTSGYVSFSLWSHNQEVIAADERGIDVWSPGEPSATQPIDSWAGALIRPNGSTFGALVKPHVPVWRARPLFNGKIAFMTTFNYAGVAHDAAELPALEVVQATAGQLHNAPSSLAAGAAIPTQADYHLWRGPTTDQAGQPLSLATPSPCPPDCIVLAGATYRSGQAGPIPAAYGIYLAKDQWEAAAPISAANVDLTLLFDDPELVDAEPVAVYARSSRNWEATPPAPPTQLESSADGAKNRPAMGNVFNQTLYSFFVDDLPGQRTDKDEGPIFDHPPAQSLQSIRIYASRRDRFDDSAKPRVAGAWEVLTDSPVRNNETFGGALPAGVPTVLAGFDKEGKIVKWTTAAHDTKGRQATFYAFAGDHYSAVRPMGKHSCTGCHPGHTTLPLSAQLHAERER